jgi:hypothetical protein
MKLQNSYVFREVCQNSDRLLRERIEMLDEIKEETNSDEELKVDYRDVVVDTSNAIARHQFNQVYVVKDTVDGKGPAEEDILDNPAVDSTEEGPSKELKHAESIINKMEASYYCWDCNSYLPTYNDFIQHKSVLHSGVKLAALQHSCTYCKEHV